MQKNTEKTTNISIPAHLSETGWAVYFGCGFGAPGDARFTPGRELPCGKTFRWGGDTWHVPSVYYNRQGLVADCCVEIGAETLASLTKRQPDGDGLLTIKVDGSFLVNRRFQPIHSSAQLTWLPESLQQGGREAPAVCGPILSHYGLDREKAWVLIRMSCRWPLDRKPTKFNEIAMGLERVTDGEPSPGDVFVRLVWR